MFFSKKKPTTKDIDSEIATPASTLAQPDNAPNTSAEGADALDRDGQDGKSAPEEMREDEYPKGVKLALVLVAVYLTMFLVILDRLIIATAIPRITDQFNSGNDVGWYGSAFFLTNCAFQLLFGKLYTLYSVRAVFLISVVVFEVGSAICGAAPSSIAFIIGRAIAGVGAAGVSGGIISVIAFTLPLHKRATYQAAFGALTGIASVIGPLVGGAFTTHVTWRWCFYLNLPLGAVTLVVVFFLLEVPERASTKGTLREKLTQLDLPGTAMIVPGVVCLVLALQWGGITLAWSNGRVIALLVLAGVLLLAFASTQVLMPRTATIAPRIFKQRSIIAASWTSFTMGAQMMVFVYYLPIWFQAIRGVSAQRSGILTLPLIMPMVLGAIFAGALTRRIGYYTPFLIAGICFMSVGAGLLTTLHVNTPMSKLIGYQFLYGFGLGMGQQAPSLAAQTVLKKDDIPVGASLVFVMQLLGGTIFISVGVNVLDSELIKRLASIPGFDPSSVTSTGVTSFVDIPAAAKAAVLSAYNASLRRVFYVGLILACLSMLGALGMEWRSMKEGKDAKKPDTEKGQQKDERTTSEVTASEANESANRRDEINEKDGNAVSEMGSEGDPRAVSK